MKTNIAILTTLLFASWTPGFAEELPADIQEILQKLEDFEHKKKEEFDALVSEKRSAVATVLEQALVRETKKGNLDSSLAIRKRIAVLRSTRTTASESELETRQDKLSDWIVGKTFDGDPPYNQFFEFSDRHVRMYKDGETGTTGEYKIINTNTVTFKAGTFEHTWKLSVDRRTASGATKIKQYKAHLVPSKEEGN